MRTHFGERERCVREFVMVDISELRRSLGEALIVLNTLAEQIEGEPVDGSPVTDREVSCASGETMDA